MSLAPSKRSCSPSFPPLPPVMSIALVPVPPRQEAPVPPGNKHGEPRRTYTIPIIAIGTPYMLKSNSPILMSGYCFSNNPATTRFVDVPIRVHVPPRILAKLSGTSNCCADWPILFDHFCTIGIITATTGVLFKKAEIIAMGIINRDCADATVLGRPSNFDIYQSSAPVLLIPSATTNKTRTVSNPSFANPSSPSGMVIMLAAINKVKEAIITESAPIRSEINAPNIKNRTPQV
mmetsp:Transcript_18082/g.39411  ORF Transcript_18082/g.39411 Transcript_18082/m.39411 type:complete len:234 (+) Transcript_18082:3276-3977(+)